MAYVLYGLLVVIALILQTTVFASLPLLGTRPDLILILVVTFAMFNGGTFGAKFGFLAGLALDLSVGRLIGLNAATKMVTGLLVGVFSERFFKENYIIPFLGVMLATWFDQLLYLLGSYLFGLSIPLRVATFQVMAPLSLYNGILTILVYVRLYYLNRRIAYWDELVKRTG